MLPPHRSATAAAVLLFGVCAAAPGSAALVDCVSHSLRTVLVDTSVTPPSLVTEDEDSEVFPAGGVCVETLVAGIGGGGDYEFDLGMLPNGVFGLDGFQNRLGRSTHTVRIWNEVTNNSARPIDVEMDFFINGGEFRLVAGQDSRLSYDLRVDGVDGGEFESSGQLIAGASGGPTFSTSGVDLGATAAVNGVSLPFSLHNVDLGQLDPGGTTSVFYTFEITLDVVDFVELASFAFADPANLSGGPLFTISSTPAAPVPGPAAAAALLGALALLGSVAAARRRGKG